MPPTLASALESSSAKDMVAVVAAERAEYATALDETQLASAHPLDLCHQSLLRFQASEPTSASRALICDQVAAYWSNPEARVDLLASKRRSSAEPRVVSERMYYSATSCAHLDAFSALASEAAEPGVRFANRHGFGVYPHPRAARHAGASVTLLPESRFASVGAMQLYCFSTDGTLTSCCAQEVSIAILAATLHWIGLNGVPESTDQGWAVGQLARACAFPDPRDWTLGRVYDASLEFLVAHELGHAAQDAPLLQAFLENLDLTPEEATFLHFPDDHDLQAWSRLRKGTGSVRDILFLLGDMLANLGAVDRGLSPEGRRLLDAFVWWFATHDEPRGRPRGVAPFLRFASEPAWLLDQIAAIAWRLRRDSHAALQELMALEASAWRDLRCA